ncbi:MAG: IS982 family transposase [Anaerolineae bacterium]|nr:IS982 family transposase [Anaerolineae bacterium]
MTDEEVITIELCGEFFKLHTDEDIFDHFCEYYQDYFPHLTDRTLFVRQAANLWQVKAAIQQQLVRSSGQADDPVQVIDTLPLPVCGYTRAYRDRCFKPHADYGHCAAKDLDYYGFKLGLRIARSGMITSFPLLPARPHDVQFLEELVEGFAGTVPADKGFIDAFRHVLLDERQGVFVITPPRKGMTTTHPPRLLRACKYLRKRVETVGSQLTERFAIARIRVRNLWHYQHRLIRKILAHTIGVFLNLQWGRNPLDLDGLLA